MVDAPHGFVAASVLLLSAYSVLKLAFFALPYARRRAALDNLTLDQVTTRIHDQTKTILSGIRRG